MKKTRMTTATAACAGVFGIVAVALAQSEDPPIQTCTIYCTGEPPVFLGSHTCQARPTEYCCTYANCTTSQYVGACCSQAQTCQTGVDPQTNLPFARCVTEQ